MKKSTVTNKRAPRARFLAVVAMLVGAAVIAAPATAQALTGAIHVNKASASCSDSGQGTAAVPFCSISAAVAKANAGSTVTVEAGTYNEKVNVPNSGTSGSPIVIRAAAGASVKISSPANGFNLSGVSWITIQGFKIIDPIGYGVNLSGTSHITVADNTVTGAGKHIAGSTKYGIIVKNTTDSTISGNQTDHNSDAGIALTLSSTNDVVSGNTSFSNARQYERAAPGIDIRASGNTIAGNTFYSNEDSGIQFYNGASNNVAVNNVSYGNGDHGVDLLSSPNNVLVSNTIYGNTTSGVTMETGSTGTTLRNNIIADNGTAQRGDIWADSTSTSGTTLDRDLVNQSGPGTLITWSGTKYGTISSFASATSDETHGLQGDPKWVNAAGGNFGLLAGSPAIDSADSSVPQETATDMLGVARFDDPGTTNTGVGPRTYDDRGALEFTGASSGPTEYVTNPGFETDLSGWAPNGKKPTLSRDGTEAHSGGFSALLSNLGTKPIACGLVDSPNWVTTSAAGTYTASMWIRSPVAGKVLTLTLNEANGTTALGSQSAHITLSTTWQQVTVQLTPTQPGTSTIGFTASVSKAPNGACFNADDISIQRA